MILQGGVDRYLTSLLITPQVRHLQIDMQLEGYLVSMALVTLRITTSVTEELDANYYEVILMGRLQPLVCIHYKTAAVLTGAIQL